jgi:hypothetical protein
LTSALDGGEWSASYPGRYTPEERASGTHWIGGWVGPRAGVDDVEKRKFLTLLGLEFRPLGHPTRSQSLYRRRYPTSFCVIQNSGPKNEALSSGLHFTFSRQRAQIEPGTELASKSYNWQLTWPTRDHWPAVQLCTESVSADVTIGQ